MDKVSVHLVYKSGIGRPLTAAKVSDPDLVCEVANRAIEHAKREASAVSNLDPFVGQVKTQEADRLESVLNVLVPELSSSPNCKS
ncbi:MAG: hypothetical protein JSV31_16340 [Desulfobacterales bacterium]|nr:MAG: hypothetical protein JSV31_16340 [Desulfobacterales bacterium]